jgi:hypothetical protein
MEPRREVTIQVAPYPDQSGYQAEARVWLDETDVPVIDIKVSYRIDSMAWGELARAINAALEFVRK